MQRVLFAPFLATPWRVLDVITLGDLYVDPSYYGFGALQPSRPEERGGPFLAVPWLFPDTHFGDVYVQTVTIIPTTGKIVEIMFAPFQKVPWRKVDTQFGAAYQSAIIGSGTVNWVRYNPTFRYWEYSIDNVNFFRLPENTYIPDNLYFKSIGSLVPTVPNLGELKLYVRDFSGTPKLAGLWSDGSETVIATGPAPVTFPAGMTSHWRLDEASGSTRNDAIGLNHLSDIGVVSQVSGRVGNGAFFDGATQRLARADNASLSMGAGVSFEFTGWVNFPEIASLPGVFGKASTGGTEYGLRINGVTSQFQFLASKVADAGAVAQSVQAASFGIPPTGTWLFFDVYYDVATGIMGISINNSGFDTLSIGTGGIWDGAFGFTVGGFKDDLSSNLMHGTVDAVTFLKGRVMTATERTNLYNSGNGLEP